MTRFWFISLALACAQLTTGCLPPNATNALSKAGTTATAAATLTVPSGARAVKIKFRTSGSGGLGSFDTPSSSGGTAAVPGSGHQIARVFNPDDSLLSSSSTASTWPKWLTSFEIGLSGTSNSSATHPDCAKFAASSEGSQTCSFSNGDTFACGGPSGYYRVSDYDCASGTIATGTGGPNDGVYLRATFSRDTTYLGASENIMAVLEYAASALNGAPSDPTSCVSSGVFDPTNLNCSDMSWQLFMKHSTSEVVQPFLLVVPPAFASVDDTNRRAGSGVQTKQFILPFAGDSSLQVMQISRIRGLSTSAPNFTARCGSGNSPYCVGMVFYSLTFYRI